jgi:lipoic acid synthetase
MPSGEPSSNADRPAAKPSLPRWLKRNVPKGDVNHFTARVLGELGLETVCDHARCPNRMECYSQRTATFLILGAVCTRGCRFCSVRKGRPRPPDADEPERLAEAAKRLGLKHVVITCVTRDDLPDGGAEHFYQTIRAVRQATGATVEVLPSDFGGNLRAVDRVLSAEPDVYNHNTETVPRLFREVRGPKSDYRQTLKMFGYIRRRRPAMPLKTGLMLGLGETDEELLETLADLYSVGCRMLTLGQYLQPSSGQMPAARYVPPAEFEQLGRFARQIGFTQVASGPFVRSSYHAAVMMAEGEKTE